MGEGIIFSKDGCDYFYRGETEATLNGIVDQLKDVQQVFKSAERLDALAKQWEKLLAPK